MYWEPSRARTLSIHWPSSYFSGVLGALKVSQRCKTAQLSSSAHSDRIQRDADTTFSRELSCAKLCCWGLFSYISGLLEDRAIIQSSLMRWSHSFRLGWRPQTGRWLSAISLSARAVAQQRRCYTDATCKQAHVTQSPIPMPYRSPVRPILRTWSHTLRGYDAWQSQHCSTKNAGGLVDDSTVCTIRKYLPGKKWETRWQG